jgi:hypothetical protein
MQPNPIADTSGPFVPSVLFIILFVLTDTKVWQTTRSEPDKTNSFPDKSCRNPVIVLPVTLLNDREKQSDIKIVSLLAVFYLGIQAVFKGDLVNRAIEHLAYGTRFG